MKPHQMWYACKECLIIIIPAKTGFPVALQLNMQRGDGLYCRERQGLGSSFHWGGTTLFFRQNALEKLVRRDAHNVTEDADIGVRLARHGYVT